MAEPPAHARTIAYAGEPGAFAEDAAIGVDRNADRLPVAGFAEVFDAVETGRAALGVVPIENLVNGTVRENLDLLLGHDLCVVGEHVVPVRLALAALPGQSLDEIERVYSHVQALGQAEAFLRSRAWTLLSTYNTAASGKLIADRGERRAAAVLSPRAAAQYGLEVLADGIEDVAGNRTRFLVVAARGVPALAGGSSAARRTTLAFGVRNEPGTLLTALRAFAEQGVNLSRLESRPSRERAWEYVFWTDADADVDTPDCVAALEALRAVSTFVRVFGSYARATD
ncbi:MAG TPA: prephenate dehydratase [Candidatus Limnocylindrales bacterium]|nr:prephenate dehydratase [Candidatus Limnocylindrales bacterium]